MRHFTEFYCTRCQEVISLDEVGEAELQSFAFTQRTPPKGEMESTLVDFEQHGINSPELSGDEFECVTVYVGACPNCHNYTTL